MKTDSDALGFVRGPTVSTRQPCSWWVGLSPVAAQAADVTPSAAHYSRPPVSPGARRDKQTHRVGGGDRGLI